MSDRPLNQSRVVGRRTMGEICGTEGHSYSVGVCSRCNATLDAKPRQRLTGKEAAQREGLIPMDHHEIIDPPDALDAIDVGCYPGERLS